MRQYRNPVGLSLLFLSAGCSAPEYEKEVVRSDLANRCSVVLEYTQGLEPFPYRGHKFIPDLFLGDERMVALGSVTGVRWHPDSGRYYVLDGRTRQVQVFSSTGDLEFSFGREGQGPGEFEAFTSRSRNRWNHLGLLGSKHILVHDRQGMLHVFTNDGAFIRRFSVSERALDWHEWRHLDPWTDGRVLLDLSRLWYTNTEEPGMPTRSPIIRGPLPLAEVDASNSQASIREIARTRNHTSLLPEGVLQGPFDTWYGRLWGSIETGLLAILPLSHFGVCFFDSELNLVASHAVDVDGLPVGVQERRSYAAWRTERLGPPPGMGGAASWEEFFPYFPNEYPRYTDMVLAPDSTAWVERFFDLETSLWDLFHIERGYLGTIAPFSDELPVTFQGQCALVVETADANRLESAVELFGVRLWCPA